MPTHCKKQTYTLILYTNINASVNVAFHMQCNWLTVFLLLLEKCGKCKELPTVFDVFIFNRRIYFCVPDVFRPLQHDNLYRWIHGQFYFRCNFYRFKFKQFTITMMWFNFFFLLKLEYFYESYLEAGIINHIITLWTWYLIFGLIRAISWFCLFVLCSNIIHMNSNIK